MIRFTVVNLAILSLHGYSLIITLTVPLNKIFELKTRFGPVPLSAGRDEHLKSNLQQVRQQGGYVQRVQGGDHQ